MSEIKIYSDEGVNIAVTEGLKEEGLKPTPAKRLVTLDLRMKSKLTMQIQIS